MDTQTIGHPPNHPRLARLLPSPKSQLDAQEMYSHRQPLPLTTKITLKPCPAHQRTCRKLRQKAGHSPHQHIQLYQASILRPSVK